MKMRRWCMKIRRLCMKMREMVHEDEQIKETKRKKRSEERGIYPH